MRGYLALEDGRVFEGESFGAEGVAPGEVVFNTSMTGYQEILTDPSYYGQIVTMTYPLIGNYGVNAEDMESAAVRVAGFVVREACPEPSNFRAEKSLQDYLVEHGIPALTEIDTRAVTKHIRTAGAMRAIIASGEHDPDDLVRKAREAPGLIGRDLVKEVTCSEPYEWTEPCPWADFKPASRQWNVVAYDFGVKYNILRYLVSAGCRVTVVPAGTSAEDVMGRNPDGVFLSNGPGDPEGVPYAAGEVRKIVGQVPIFGICLGQQILGLALEGKTFKLKFGHRGGNQPVMDMQTRRVGITSQNHGFCVENALLDSSGTEVTHVNLNDQTVEGLVHRHKEFLSVQHHPEASPGPHDAAYLFERFVEMMEAHAQAH